MKRIILSAALMTGIFFCLSAQTRTPKATQRQANQQGRIQQGAQSGQLTPAETKKLEQEQANVQKTKKAAKADGVVTPSERAQIHRQQNKASNHINKEKHDNQKR